MSDLIDREQAIAKIEDLNAISFYELNEHSKEAYSEIMAAIKNMPSAEKTGKWIRLYDDKSILGCSVCGKWACLSNYINEGEKDGQFKSPYCPYCGAKMEGEQT